ncbi:MAG: response regulator transcription factor [Planctomycetes bacterium]|nr:response regulator transcription factor [Planctomycetota bacterium]
MERIRILVADDHAIVREGIRRILTDAPEVEVVAEAGDAAEVLRLVRELPLDIVLLDISFPGKSGLEILAHLKAVKPELPVLMLSMFPEEQFALRAIKAGAAGYLTKESAPAELVTAVRDVAAGRRSVSAGTLRQLVDRLNAPATSLPHEALTTREFSVFLMIAQGRTLTQIAADLSLSVKTVSTHRRRLLGKLGLRNNVDLSKYAVQHNLLV